MLKLINTIQDKILKYIWRKKKKKKIIEFCFMFQ